MSKMLPGPHNRTFEPAEQPQLRAAYLTALVEASKIVNSTLDLDRLLELILEVATKELNADRGTVYTIEAGGAELHARISQGLESKILKLKLGQGIAGQVAETGETVRIEDAYNDQRFFQQMDAASGYRTTSMLCTPIRSKTGELVGVIQLLNKRNGTFTFEDEVFLQALAVHFALAMVNAKLHAEQLRHQRIRTELELARQIQQNLLKAPPKQWKGYRLAARSEPCYEVGGDFFDFLRVSDTTLWVVIADVSGKGISAALVTSTLQATLHALLVGVHSFEKMLERLNGMVQEFTGGAHYVTMFLALLDAESRRIHYINAGHNPPLILRANGRIEQLAANGTVVGLLPRVQFTRSLAELGPDDVLVLYTDGVAEAEGPGDQLFDISGIDRTVSSLRPDTSPDAILDKLFVDVRDFTKGAPASDDRTVIVISPVPEADD